MARRFVKSGSVVEREIRKSRILVPLGSDNARIDNIYTLNPMAALIWEKAVLGLSEDEIVALIIDAFDIDEPTARRDAGQLLDQFQSIGALEVVQTEG